MGPLVLESSPGLDRFAAGRGLLARADQIIVVAGADPEAVVQLAEWKAAARTLKVAAPCWALFGRTPKGSYETSHLRASLQATTASDAGAFAEIDFLPDDHYVARARWNGDMVGTRPVAYRHQSAGPPTRRANHRHPHRSLDRQPAGPHPPGPGESQAKRMVVTTTATPFERLLARVQGILNTRNSRRGPRPDPLPHRNRSRELAALRHHGRRRGHPIQRPRRRRRTNHGRAHRRRRHRDRNALVADPDVEEIYGTDGDLSYRTTSGHTKAVPTPVSPTALLHTIQRLVASASEAAGQLAPRADGVRVILPNGRQGRLSALDPAPDRRDGRLRFAVAAEASCHFGRAGGLGVADRPGRRLLRILMLVTRSKLLVVGPPGAGKTSPCRRPIARRPGPAADHRDRRRTGAHRAVAQRRVLGDQPGGGHGGPDPLGPGGLAGADRVGRGERRRGVPSVMAGNLGTGVMAAVHADSTAKAFDALADAASPAMPAMTTPSAGEVLPDLRRRRLLRHGHRRG